MKRVWNNPIISDLTIKQTEATCPDLKKIVTFSNEGSMVYHTMSDISEQCCGCYNYLNNLCTITDSPGGQTSIKNVISCSA